MPRQAADLEEALNKKGGLTLSQLANYDDLITDALVDRVRIPRLRGSLDRSNADVCLGVLLVLDPQTESKLPSLPRRTGGFGMQNLTAACHH